MNRMWNLVLLILLLCGCSSEQREATTVEQTPTMILDKSDVFKCFKVKDSTLYYGDEERTLTYYNSIVESFIASGLAHKNSMPKLIHEFKLEDGTTRAIIAKQLLSGSKSEVHVVSLYQHTKTKLYSELITVETSKIVSKYEPIYLSLDRDLLFSREIFDRECNKKRQFFGITSDYEKVKTLKIEGQMPSGIKKIELNGIEYYFWYYNDLKASKKAIDFKIEYKGRDEDIKVFELDK